MKYLGILVVLLFATHSNASCPVEPGETAETSCGNEQVFVENALVGNSIDKHYTYCLQAKPGSDGEGIQCRGPVLYKDNSGSFTDEIFEDRFIASEVDRTSFFSIYFVKKANGLYNAYIDRSPDGVLNIDLHIVGASQDIAVTFDSQNRPSFTTEFIKAGTNPPELSSSTLTHFGSHADLTNNVTGDPNDTKRYMSINPVQVAQ
ncbi:MAG: hypothetical protein AAF203_01710 [Pseudomonadota bacterium]